MNIAIIPARKNSRRIKNKNIIKFCGKPIIYYSLKAAKKSKLFDKIIVTTDCKKINKLSYYYGADLVINRKEKLAKNNIIHKNKAANLKSKLTKQVATL